MTFIHKLDGVDGAHILGDGDIAGILGCYMERRGKDTNDDETRRSLMFSGEVAKKLAMALAAASPCHMVYEGNKVVGISREADGLPESIIPF